MSREYRAQKHIWAGNEQSPKRGLLSKTPCPCEVTKTMVYPNTPVIGPSRSSSGFLKIPTRAQTQSPSLLSLSPKAESRPRIETPVQELDVPSAPAAKVTKSARE